MEQRVNSLETDLEILKRDMSACQASIHKDISMLKDQKQDLPLWLKSSAVAVVFAIFGQTITSVWWAATITSRQEAIQSKVQENTNLISTVAQTHEQVMLSLKEIQINNKNMKEMLHDIKNKQNGHAAASPQGH
jgi:Tfp pilus assembly protein PilO